MGLVSALVYLLVVTVFLPFAFKTYLVEALYGVREKELESQLASNGRFLHRFPLEKAGISTKKGHET